LFFIIGNQKKSTSCTTTLHGNWTSALQLAHHLADISQASPALGVFRRTLTIAKFFFRLDFFHNCGTPIILVIPLYIFSREAKTVTDHFAHGLSFSFFSFISPSII
jgi:hypothetical protein